MPSQQPCFQLRSQRLGAFGTTSSAFAAAAADPLMRTLCTTVGQVPGLGLAWMPASEFKCRMKQRCTTVDMPRSNILNILLPASGRHAPGRVDRLQSRRTRHQSQQAKTSAGSTRSRSPRRQSSSNQWRAAEIDHDTLMCMVGEYLDHRAHKAVGRGETQRCMCCCCQPLAVVRYWAWAGASEGERAGRGGGQRHYVRGSVWFGGCRLMLLSSLRRVFGSHSRQSS